METQLHAKNQKKKYRTVKAVGPEHADGRTHAQTHESEFIGSFRSLKTSGEPKIRKIHRGVWKLQAHNSKIGLKWTKFRYSMAKNSHYTKFSGIQNMIFSKRTIRTTSVPKIRKIHSGVWKLQVKYTQNSQFWPKNGQILVLNGQNFAISEFPRHIEYDFLKEDHKNNFHTKNQEDSQRRMEVRRQKLSNCQFWPKMAKFWS